MLPRATNYIWSKNIIFIAIEQYAWTSWTSWTNWVEYIRLSIFQDFPHHHLSFQNGSGKKNRNSPCMLTVLFQQLFRFKPSECSTVLTSLSPRRHSPWPPQMLYVIHILVCTFNILRFWLLILLYAHRSHDS